MLASALLTLVSWVTPAVPTLVLYAAEALALVSLGSVYWNNVDVWVLARLKCSYEVFVILSSASASIVVNWHAAELGTYSDGSDDGGGDDDYAASAAMMNNLHATVDSCAFACLTVLFVFADSLQVRSRWFRKFCFVIFMTFVAINAVASQLLPDRVVELRGFGHVSSRRKSVRRLRQTSLVLNTNISYKLVVSAHAV